MPAGSDPLAELNNQVRAQRAAEAAAGKLAAARAALVLGKDAARDPGGAGAYAFLASLALRLRLEQRDAVGTMATDGRFLWWNVDYVTPLDPFQTLSEVCHETFHCALLHPARLRDLLGAAASSDRVKRAQIAADCAIDPLLRDAGFWNPPGAIFPAAYGLPEGQTLEWYFANLPADAGQGSDAAAADHGQVAPAGGDGTGDAAADAAAAAETAAEWSVAIEQARRAAKMRGTMPAAWDALCDAVLKHRVDWRAVLREFFNQVARDDYAWTRPNRRHVADGLYLPSCYSERLGGLVVVVDTSGSMSETALAAGLGEVAALVRERPQRVDVLLHDSRLYKTVPVDVDAGDDMPPVKVRRGGTSHRQAFEWIRANAPDAVAVLCFTDCESDLDAIAAPAAPCLFFRPADCDSPAPAWAAAVANLPDA